MHNFVDPFEPELSMKLHVLILLFVSSIILSSVVFSQDVVHFPDPDLEAAIRTALQIPDGDITTEDMAMLVDLRGDLDIWGVSDLSGLEHAVNLRILAVSRNYIHDLSPLAGLQNLTTLDLARNRVTDIGPLVNLTQLESLDLSGNAISDLSPLQDLTNLKSLYLDRNLIRDLNPLAGLTQLEFLSLGGIYWGGNLIRNIDALATLTQLRDRQEMGWGGYYTNSGLDLNGNAIDISQGSPARVVIDSLSAIDGLTVDYEEQKLVPEIPDPGLEAALRAALNKFTGDITFDDMEQLTVLEANQQDIVSLEGLEFAANLTSLKLAGNRIEDLRSIAVMTGLSWLDLSDNLLTSGDLYYLTALSNLQDLDLNGNTIRDIKPLLAIESLEEVHLDNNYLDLSPGSAAREDLDQLLTTGASVTHQNQRESEIVDIPNPDVEGEVRKILWAPEGPLTKAEMETITGFGPFPWMWAPGNLAGLEHATNLTWISLSGWSFWSLDDISAIANLEKVTFLRISLSTLSHLPPLAGMKSLRELDLDHSPDEIVNESGGWVYLPK